MARLSKWDLFTPVMHGLDPLRRPWLRRAVQALRERVPLGPGVTLLDVGSGTGTALRELLPYGCTLTASEPTETMRRSLERNFSGVRVLGEPAHAMVSVPDASQDITLVSATLHGLPPEYRARVYPELSRVTRGVVAIVDYHFNYDPITALVEALEGGDYFNFIRVVDRELREAFGPVETVRTTGTESLYLCRPGHPGNRQETPARVARPQPVG